MMPIVVREDNTIEIPSELGQRLGITPGSQIYIYQIGETLSVRLKPSTLLEACAEFEAIMMKDEGSLDDLLKGLEEEREAVAQERPASQMPNETA